MKLVKTIIKTLLRKTGRTIQPINVYEEQLEQVKYNWLHKYDINTVIDIGASDGGFVTRIRKIFPDATIYSFEALNEPFNKLKNKFNNDKNFFSFNIALSNYNGETEFYECKSSGSSSLLEMAELHKTVYPQRNENKLIKLKCSRLDDFLETQNINLNENIMLKLDVQGAEKLVLEGSEKLLNKTAVIFTEINFNSLYNGSILFNDLSHYLYNKGFKMEGIENISQSLIDGTFLQADAYFINTNLSI